MARDRIARRRLPGDILNHILKYLPLRDAVRTSILSKDWRYKWLTIPYLVFDNDFEYSLPERYTPEFIINRILAHHVGPIIKSKFTCEAIEDDSIIEIWLKLLSYHSIEDFTLWRNSAILDEMPKHVFSFDCLKHLNLCYVNIRLPPMFNGFSRLLTLFLENVSIDSKDFNLFVSKCPALEVLHLLQYDAISLVIDAPNLKSFNFSNNFKSLIFVNMMNIEEISICASNHNGGGGGGDYDLLPVNGSNLINFLGQLPSVRKLAFDENFLKFLAKGGVPDKLPNYLHQLTTLEFVRFDFGAMTNVTCLLCLIRSSPNLQSLEIGAGFVYRSRNTFEAPVEYLKAQQKCEVSFGHNIKNITMDGFRGLKAEMIFVKVMLLKSMLLRELIIKFPRPHAPEGVHEVVKALAGLRRASSKAVIKFG